MAKLAFVLGFLVTVLGYYLYVAINSTTKVDFPTTGFYGSGKVRADDTKITPFKVNVPETVLEDLKTRLQNSRVGHAVLEDSDDFWYGFNSKYLDVVKDYWLTKYDWRKSGESVINKFPQFITEIEGVKVHFIHSKPRSSYRSVPLLMVHGWPGNVFEFSKIIPILNDPKAHGIDSDLAFEVIAPSIPGYGWSEQPKKTGFSQVACARVFRKLMLRLKFEKFFMQGGDWGSVVTGNLIRMYPENVGGLHTNMVMVPPDSNIKAFLIDVLASFFPKMFLSSPNLQNHNFFGKFLTMIKESGYMHIQATKPDTVGTSLNDSPLGLAAYILEKFSTWTNQTHRSLPDGGLTRKFTMDELLTMVMVYWVNGNIVSSQRFYREFFLDDVNKQLGKQYVSIPIAHASGLSEMFDRTPLEITRTLCNITQYTEIEDMGHFACLEEPKKMAVDIVKFFNTLA